VEGDIFLAFLRTHSPGQFVWYVLRQYGYRYAKLSAGYGVTKPALPRFEGEPFAIPDDVQALQAAAGRKPKQGAEFHPGTPTAEGVRPPPSVGIYSKITQFRQV
jgi:hypothetical protein